jgi:uncharacterized protein (UPF0332 family)
VSRGADHPPKKKHANRPRPEPIPPLTDGDRALKAREEFDKALIHLIEAERLAGWNQAPNACIHSAYYAMYHAASASILAAGGVGKLRDVPKSHEHVLQHYGKLVADEPGELGQSGRVLSRARNDRMIADYGIVHGASPFDAADTTAQARKFVDACRIKWNFSDKVRTRGGG